MVEYQALKAASWKIQRETLHENRFLLENGPTHRSTSKKVPGGRRSTAFLFHEQGVLGISSLAIFACHFMSETGDRLPGRPPGHPPAQNFTFSKAEAGSGE